MNTNDEKHLLLIDGLNIVRRVYEAIPAPDSDKKAQGAIQSSLASIQRALNTHKPTHLLILFDFGGHTWRHDLYPQYRADRKPMPQELRNALPDLYSRLTDMHLKHLAMAEVEADDVLAAVSQRWISANKGTVTILSTDKDMLVLTAIGAKVWNHFTKELCDEAWIQAKFGVNSEQIHDFLALTGDASDGVPGVPGIGAKTASKLLKEYGTLEQVLAAAPTIKGSIGLKLTTHSAEARLSRQLVAFKTDMPLGITWNSLKYSQDALETPATTAVPQQNSLI